MKLSVSAPALIIFAVAILASPVSYAQEQRAKEWHCLKQGMVENTDGNVTAMPCQAALPNGERLDAEDENMLSKLERIRFNAVSGQDTAFLNTVRMGFGQAVGQVCQKHPNIVLAALFPDSSSGRFLLYSCKNIIAAPEK